MNSVKSKLNAVVAENGDYPKVKELVEQFIIGTLNKIAQKDQSLLLVVLLMEYQLVKLKV